MPKSSPNKLSDLEAEIRGTSEKISSLFQKDARTRGRSFRLLTGWAVIVGAILVGAAQASLLAVPATADEPAIWRGSFTLIGILISAIGGVLSLVNDLSTPEALQHARDMEDQAIKIASHAKQLAAAHGSTVDDLTDQLEELDLENDWLADLYTLQSTIHETLENVLSSPTVVSDSDIDDLLSTIARFLVKLLEFDASQIWTISIYRFTDDERSSLRCVATQRSDRSDENGNRREWPVGYGLVGEVARRKCEIVISNARDAKEARFINLPDALGGSDKLAADLEKYVSMAGVPIRIAADDDIWGVAVATSDQAGFFNVDDEGESDTNVEPLRLLARSIALMHAPSGAKNEPSASA